MAQGAPLRGAGKKMNDRLLFLSLNEITHYFERWTTGRGVLKKICCHYKNVMFQIYPPESSCCQKEQHPRKDFKVKSTPKKQLFG